MLFGLILACTPKSADVVETSSPQTTGTEPTASTSTSPTSTPTGPCAWDGEATIGPAEGCAIYTRDADLDVTGLTVEPGTTIELGAGVVITVHAWMDAEGTVGDPIVFEASGDPWGGLDLDWDPDDDTYENYDSPHWDGVSGQWTLDHVTLRDAGAGRDAALVVEGGATFCGDGCAFAPGIVSADGLAVEGSESGGVQALLADPDFDSPIAFSDVAGYLLDVDVSALDQGDMALDGGGNAVPAIRVHVATQFGDWVAWNTQAVPLDFVDPVLFPLTEDPAYYRPWGPFLTIQPNTLRFAGGVGIAVDAGDVDATGVTFEALDPAAPWEGIRSSGDAIGHGIFGAPVTVHSTLELAGCTVTGATSPAIDWASPSTPPSVTGTLVADVSAAPGDDVCVSACNDLLAANLANTLDCTIPELCP